MTEPRLQMSVFYDTHTCWCLRGLLTDLWRRLLSKAAFSIFWVEIIQWFKERSAGVQEERKSRPGGVFPRWMSWKVFFVLLRGRFSALLSDVEDVRVFPQIQINLSRALQTSSGDPLTFLWSRSCWLDSFSKSSLTIITQQDDSASRRFLWVTHQVLLFHIN